jgi:DNA repair protein RadA/Sms
MRIKMNDAFEFGTTLNEVEVPDAMKKKIASGLEYWDAALGGQGFTPGAVTLFTGGAGAGKTTTMLLLADALSRNGAAVVFNSGEESLFQLRMTSQRLGLLCHFVASNEIHVPTLLDNCTKMRNSAKHKGKPFFLILDSLQCMDDGHYADGATNSKTPERVLQLVTEYAKEHYVNPIVIGQVTKGGKFAGSNTLKHMVDCHCHLSIETKDPDLAGLRILEVEKNRYGGAGSRQFLAMTESGFTLIATA